MDQDTLQEALRQLVSEGKIEARWDPEVEDFRFYPVEEEWLRRLLHYISCLELELLSGGELTKAVKCRW